SAGGLSLARINAGTPAPRPSVQRNSLLDPEQHRSRAVVGRKLQACCKPVVGFLEAPCLLSPTRSPACCPARASLRAVGGAEVPGYNVQTPEGLARLPYFDRFPAGGLPLATSLIAL